LIRRQLFYTDAVHTNVKRPVPDMTYNVFGGTLSLTQSINQLHKRQPSYSSNNYVKNRPIFIVRRTGIRDDVCNDAVVLLSTYSVVCWLHVTLQTAAAAAAAAAADDDDGDGDKRHVVNILVQMQRQVESNVGLKHVSQSLQLLHIIIIIILLLLL